MLKQKRWGIFILFVAVICCLSLTMPGLYFTAQASTDTDGMWQSGQTQNLIPWILSTDTWDSLVAKGWGKANGQNTGATLEVIDTNSDGFNFGDGRYGVRPTSDGADLGTQNYEGGIYYTIQLSEADQNKANLGQLSISASSNNYRQAAATANCSVRAVFLRADGSEISTIKKTQTCSDGEQVTLSATSIDNGASNVVPAETVSIQIWFSNRNSLTYRPWIANMQCYLYDTTAPKAVSAAIVSTDGGAAPSYTVPGGSFCYQLNFDEKVIVTQNGTATIELNGVQYTSTGATVVQTSDGKTQINYAFTLPATGGTLYSDGTVTLQSVSGLSAQDEADSALDTSSVISAVNGAPTLIFYGLKDVITSTTGLMVSGQSSAVYGQPYTATLSATVGYNLPASVTILVGGVPLAVGQYTYNTVTGEISITAAYVTGDITITANGVPKQYTIFFDQGSGLGGTSSADATYDAALPAITAPSRTGYTFGGYYTERNGEGTLYYSESGAGVLPAYSVDNDLTLYANWTANRYTVEYNPNKPSGASSQVQGETVFSSHTYDEEKQLTASGFTLTGWTFMGWATESGGGVVYENSASVSNLTDEADGRITLYAVWAANTYTVSYNANEPSGSSSEVSGSTTSSFHSYDTSKALTTNGFTLTGWTFMGWNTQADGNGTSYENGATVLNLTAAAGGTFSLYAIWTANTYSVNYDANKPDGASHTVEGSMTSSTHSYDTAGALSENGFTLTGWTFMGWATSANGVVTYQDGEEVLNLTSVNGETVVLYAVWTANRYTVEYNPNKPAAASGEIVEEMENSSHTYDEEKTLTANAYTLTGWMFRGWATESGGDVVYTDMQNVNTLVSENGGSITLYAVWEANDYTITLNAAGGSNSGSVGPTFDSILTDIPAIPARYGYNFRGYFDAEAGGVQYYGADGKAFEDKTFTTDSNIILYAQWSPITYTIELYSEGNYIDCMEEVV